MKIVISGAGKVGKHLAKLLSNEGQDIIIMDEEQSKLECLESYNLLPQLGNPSSFKTMKKVGVDGADLYIAVTPSETRNVVSCSMAKHLGAKRTVARIDNYEYLNTNNRDYFAKIGVDHLVYPEYLAAKEIITALQHSWVRNWFELFDGELIVVGVKVRENARLVGMPLKELYTLSNYMHISAIRRKNETIIPRGEDKVEANDIVYIASTQEFVGNIIDLCGKKKVDVKKVMVMGGSRIAVQLAKMSSDKYKIKIIESDFVKAQELAVSLPECTIVNADGRDIDILKNEGIDDCDAFVTLTDSSETNILGCLTAKEYGIRKTIAEVENIQLITEAESLNIGTALNKKLLASSRIFQILLDNDSTNAKCLALVDAEVAEMVVKEGSKVTREDVKDLDLPREITIAGLVRDGHGMLVHGDTRLQAGDHVVIFCLSGSIRKAERLFNKK
jgi:trk system potassium uptake protein TrkA